MPFINITIAIIFGLLLGNYATTALYRLPNNISIYGFGQNKKRPICSKCGHSLRFYEYLPVLHLFTCRGKCNYCFSAINPLYLILELFGGTFSVICYLRFGFGDLYILILMFGIISVLGCFIYILYSKILLPITISITVLGTIYKTLIDQTIYYWTLHLAIASIISIWLISYRSNEKQTATLLNGAPILIHLIIPASIWLKPEFFLIYIAFLFAHYLINQRNGKPYRELAKTQLYSFGTATMLVIFYIVSVY